MKQFKVMHKGKESVIGIDDDLSFGEMEDVLNKHIKMEDVLSGKMNKVNLVELIKDLCIVAIKESPEPIATQEDLRNYGIKAVNKIIEEVSSEYPLTEYLETIAKALGAEKQTTPQPSISQQQQPSGGQNGKPTSTE